jgi:hypothetical protein
MLKAVKLCKENVAICKGAGTDFHRLCDNQGPFSRWVLSLVLLLEVGASGQNYCA